MDLSRPVVHAVAARDGRIVAVDADALALRGPHTTHLDLAGGLAVPGLCDAHAHLVGLGAVLEQIDLRGTRSPEEAVARVRQHAPASGWIVGRGWDQNLWPGAAMPDHTLLSAAFPERPVWLSRVDGHAAWANLAALRAAQLTPTTPVPQGGELAVRSGPDGPELTGLLIDAAMDLVPVPSPGPTELRRQILAAQAQVLALGLTGIHEMGVSAAADAVLRELAATGELRLRLTGYADADWFAAELQHRAPEPPTADDHYRLVGVKLYVDGALGSRGAALLAAYSDRPDHFGNLQYTAEQLAERVAAAHARGWQVAAHAIGDRAIRSLLDAFATSPAHGPRPRVEHAQIVDLADIPRFTHIGVIASMQPTHATSDMAWVPDRIGPDRLAGAYAWRRFLAAGVPLAFGSDFPVEQPDPRHGIHAAVTRQDQHGSPPQGWLPDQCLQLEQALAGFTIGAAVAANHQLERGLIAPGMVADLTCFATDLQTLAPAELRDAPLRATVIAGQVVWSV